MRVTPGDLRIRLCPYSCIVLNGYDNIKLTVKQKKRHFGGPEHVPLQVSNSVVQP